MHIFNINAHYKFLTCPSSALLAEQHNTIRLLHSQQKQSLVTGEKGWEYVKQFSEQLNLDTEHVTHYRYLSLSLSLSISLSTATYLFSF